MKQIQIIIPTRNRVEKLKKTLASIPKLPYISVVVACDNDIVTHKYLQDLCNSQVDSLVVLAGCTEFSGSVECKNLCCPNTPDGLLYATDDIIFHEGAIQAAFECFNNNFPAYIHCIN